jgi:hypothetical protein
MASRLKALNKALTVRECYKVRSWAGRLLCVHKIRPTVPSCTAARRCGSKSPRRDFTGNAPIGASSSIARPATTSCRGRDAGGRCAKRRRRRPLQSTWPPLAVLAANSEHPLKVAPVPADVAANRSSAAAGSSNPPEHVLTADFRSAARWPGLQGCGSTDKEKAAPKQGQNLCGRRQGSVCGSKRRRDLAGDGAPIGPDAITYIDNVVNIKK